MVRQMSLKMESPVADIDRILLPALEQSFMAVVLIDEQDRVLFFNQAAERLWGYARDEVLGRSMQLLLPHSLHSVHGDYIRKNREGGQARVVGMSRDIRMERKDGRQLWASFSLSKIDVAGRIHYMALARDVSDEVLRREENRLLLLAVNHTDRVVCVLDDQRRIVRINRAFTNMFGYEAAEVLGRAPGDFLVSPRADRETLNWLRNRTWDTEGFHEEMLVVDKAGRDVWVRVSIDPVFSEDEERRLRNLVVGLSDVTEDRQIRDLQRDVLEALISGLALKDVGELLCRRVEGIAPGVTSSIQQVDAERKLRPWAAPRLPAEYNASLDGVPIGEGVGSCGTAAFRGEPVQVTDIETDPLWAPYRHLTLPYGLRACWSYPIRRRDGSVAGTFAFYFTERRGPDAFLERIVDACVHLCTLAIDREESRQQIDRLIQFDGLTGLPNRRHLHLHIDEMLAAMPREEIAFFWLNLDRFEDINDTLGYSAGDQVLVEMANRLKKQLSQGEFLARTEGDSYVIVAPGCDARRAALIAGCIQKAVGAEIEVAGFSLNLSVRIGISHYPEGGRDREILLQSAKNAVYRLKESGGNDYLFFSPELNRIARDRLLLGAALKRAIAGDGLRLQYQPQLRPGCRELRAVEALARWTDPELGEIAPCKFIGLAEEIGEIDAISHWALREACRQMAEWRSRGVPVPMVAVNLSPANFRDKGLPDFISGVLNEHALPGECLTIEITEGLVMELTPETLDMLHEIRALGVGLSVDDFGTGFSSLSSLANLPVSEIKIDRSFIDKCAQEKRAQALVKAVIGIGRSLDLTVVAEGVETEAQYRLLKELRCPALQGYLFARPLPPVALESWLNERLTEEAE
jgi:c-di-GMP-specific phosphodiesterase